MVKLGPLGPPCLNCGRGEGHPGPCTTDHLVHRCYRCRQQTYNRRCVNAVCPDFGKWIPAFPPEPSRLRIVSERATAAFWQSPAMVKVTLWMVLLVTLVAVGAYGILLWNIAHA